MSGSNDLADRLGEFEALRYPRTSAVQNGSRFWGEWSHAGGVEAELRNVALRAAALHVYDYLDWLYGTDRRVAIPAIPPSRDRYAVAPAERDAYADGLARS